MSVCDSTIWFNINIEQGFVNHLVELLITSMNRGVWASGRRFGNDLPRMHAHSALSLRCLLVELRIIRLSAAVWTGVESLRPIDSTTSSDQQRRRTDPPSDQERRQWKPASGRRAG